MGDYYEILGLDRSASLDEIRDAYFTLARSTHPDVNSDPGAREAFLEIQEAYEVLRDAGKRSKYDGFLPDEKKNDPKIKITVKQSKSAIAMVDEQQLFYVLLDMECIAREDEIVHPQSHYCFVIDRSTSMDGERMATVKSNLLKILPRLYGTDLVSIITFSDRAEVLCASEKVSQIHSIEKKIESVSCSGSTEIYKGLKAGVDLLRLGSINHLTRHLILLTDGNTYGDEAACLELAKDAFAQGIMISAMGLGHEWNDVFLDELATSTGGSTVFVKSAGDLYNYLVQKIDLGKAIYAGNLSYEFTCDPEVKLKSVFRLQPEIMPLELEREIPLGDLAFGSKSQFLFEFMIDEVKMKKGAIHLATGRVKMDLYGNSPSKAKIRLNLTTKLQEHVEKENPPVEIIRALSKLTLYQMQERTRKDVAGGDFQSAVKRMHYLASKLLVNGDRGLARQILVEAENVNSRHRYSDDGDKQIKYGTRGLLLLPGPEPRIL
jgi:Ca-activated chloride channel family protein